MVKISIRVSKGKGGSCVKIHKKSTNSHHLRGAGMLKKMLVLENPNSNLEALKSSLSSLNLGHRRKSSYIRF